MTKICENCGLPIEICICEDIAKENQNIVIKIESRKYNKSVTIINGISQDGINIPNLVKTFKKKLACGGSYKHSNIELQGSHSARVKEILIKNGFNHEQIKIL